MQFLALCVAATVLWIPRPVQAAEPARANFDVTVIEAKKEAGEVDRKLDHLKDVLDRSFKGYKSFRQVNRAQFTVSEGKPHTMALSGAQKLNLALLAGGAKGFVKVRLETGDLKTTIDVKDGGLFFQAVRGPSGAALVIAIQASLLKPARAR